MMSVRGSGRRPRGAATADERRTVTVLPQGAICMICKMREHAESNVCSELAQAPAGTDHKRLRINRCRVLQLRRGIAARNRFEGPPSCGDAGPVSKTQLADDLGAMVLSPLLSGTAQRRAASRRSAPAARAMAEPAVEPASGSPPTARALSVDLQGPVPRRPPLPPLVAVPPGGPNIPEQRRSRGPVAATCPSILYRGALLGRQLWFLVPHLILLEITFRGWVARAGHSAGHSAPGQSWRHGRPRPCLIPQLSGAPPRVASSARAGAAAFSRGCCVAAVRPAGGRRRRRPGGV